MVFLEVLNMMRKIEIEIELKQAQLNSLFRTHIDLVN